MMLSHVCPTVAPSLCGEQGVPSPFASPNLSTALWISSLGQHRTSVLIKLDH
jgi:hypothetical protein